MFLLHKYNQKCHCTMNIFYSKSGHNNNCKNCKIFFIFLQFLLYLMIFLSSAAHLALSILKNHQILQKVWRKWRKIFQLLYYLNVRFWNQTCSQCIGPTHLLKHRCHSRILAWQSLNSVTLSFISSSSIGVEQIFLTLQLNVKQNQMIWPINLHFSKKR